MTERLRRKLQGLEAFILFEGLLCLQNVPGPHMTSAHLQLHPQQTPTAKGSQPSELGTAMQVNPTNPTIRTGNSSRRTIAKAARGIFDVQNHLNLPTYPILPEGSFEHARRRASRNSYTPERRYGIGKDNRIPLAKFWSIQGSHTMVHSSVQTPENQQPVRLGMLP